MTSDKPHPDQRYIDGLCNNDSKVVNEIYREFSPPAIRYVRANSGNLQDAEDVFNKVLIIIFRNACQKKDFTLTGSFGGYLMRILTRKWIDELNARKNSGVTYRLPDGYEHEGTDELNEKIDEWLKEDRQKKIFLRCFKKLTENCRTILEKSWELGDMQEVARQLGKSYGYVRKRKSVCRAKLAELVREDPEFDQLSEDE